MSSSTSSSSYRRVPQRETNETAASEISSGGFESSAGTTTPNTRSQGERLEEKGVALVWLVVALVLARWTNFFPIVWSDPRLNRTLLRVAGGGFILVLALFSYLTLYLPKIKGLSDPSVWGVYCPKVFPGLLLACTVTYLIFVRALWPLWGFWAPLLSGTEIMGILMSFHFIPVFGLC